MYRFGIATIFENIPDGYEFTDEAIPLHLTHVDVCEVDLEPSELIGMLADNIAEVPVFNVLPTQDVWLGPNKEVPVTLIDLSPELVAFHRRLLQFLGSHNAVLDNPQFHDDQYLPHVSIYGQRRVELGKPLSISSLSIGHKRTDISNPPNRIIATLPLRQ